MTPDRRLIEDTFPVKEVSQHSVREKNIRHGHISTLHIWWARRPLAASRATAYAALVPSPQDLMAWQSQHNFIAEFCQWENSLNPRHLARARQAIYTAHAERLSKELGKPVTVEDIEAGRVPPPRVLDPFAGGGSYPLEALRLGCEAYANDYNPVAVLILKATLEYPQKYGRPFPGMPEIPDTPMEVETDEETDEQDIEFSFADQYTNGETPNPLLKAVRYWGRWVLEEARRELAPYYRGQNGEKIVSYIWARTLPCQNPKCGVEIPLMRQYWLAKKDKKKISLRPIAHGPGRPITFEIVAQDLPGYAAWPKGFNPEEGTVSRAVVTCPACGAVMDDDTTRHLFRSGKGGQRMVAVVYVPEPTSNKAKRGEGGKRYRLPTAEDFAAYHAAEQALAQKVKVLREQWGIEPIPSEPTPEGKGSGAERAFSVRNYGLNTWGDLFNPRQQLALVTFADAVRRAHAVMLAQGYPEEFSGAVIGFLALVFSRHSSYNAALCWWETLGERSYNVFGRQALPMVFDNAEQVPFDTLTGSWKSQLQIALSIVFYLSQIFTVKNNRDYVTHVSATRLPYPDHFFDAILTDPPYYDNVPYSYLSDFFYVWLKRTVGHLYPDLFATPLTPKSEEIVAYSNSEGGLDAGMRFFEENLARAFGEMQRVLKPDGIAVIVYAHKSTAGWETVINALLDSGLVVTAAWPIHTEMQARLRANESAALASSIYIVARKAQRLPTGFYTDVRAELRRYLDTKLQRLWDEGISGPDFFIAAIGAAIEVFGKYEQVMDFEGNVIRAERLLQDVRELVTDYTVRQILKNGFAGEVSNLTRFYVLWRWNYGEAKVPFDDARKLAQSCGLDLAQEWSRRGAFIRKDKEFVRVLGPGERQPEILKDSRELIDVLHYSLYLWSQEKRQDLVAFLKRSGFGTSEAFYRVAQAISESLPKDSREKKLLDGLLTARARLEQEVKSALVHDKDKPVQGKLWEE